MMVDVGEVTNTDFAGLQHDVWSKAVKGFLLYIAPLAWNVGSAHGADQLHTWTTAGKNLKQQSEAHGEQAKPVL